MQRRNFLKTASAGASIVLGLPVTAGASSKNPETAQVQSREGLDMEAINEQRERVSATNPDAKEIELLTDDQPGIVANPQLNDDYKKLVSYTIVSPEEGPNKEHFGYVSKLEKRASSKKKGGHKSVQEQSDLKPTIEQSDTADIYNVADEWMEKEQEKSVSTMSSFGSWGSDMHELTEYDVDHDVKWNPWYGSAQDVGWIHWTNSVGIHDDTAQIMGIQSDVGIEAGANRGSSYEIDRAVLTHDWNEGGDVNADVDRQSIYPRSNATGEVETTVGVEISSDGVASASLEHSYSQPAVNTDNESQIYGNQLGKWSHEVSGPASERRTYFQPISLAEMDDFWGCEDIVFTGLRVDWDGLTTSSTDDFTLRYDPFRRSEC